MGENQTGIWKPKLSKSIIIPKNNSEYIAPFLRKIYFLIFSILLMVNWRTTNAPKPFPSKIRGTDIVKANAPRTPSMEKVASITSR